MLVRSIGRLVHFDMNLIDLVTNFLTLTKHLSRNLIGRVDDASKNDKEYVNISMVAFHPFYRAKCWIRNDMGNISTG